MTDVVNVESGAMALAWHPEERLAVARFVAGARLGRTEATLLVESLTAWIGAVAAPFGLLADTAGVQGTDAEYRSIAHEFFKRHRDRAVIAVTHMGPIIRIVAEMFRVGTGIQLKGFDDDASARAWLRSRGVAA